MKKEGWLAFAAVLIIIIAIALLMTSRAPTEPRPGELAAPEILDFQFAEVVSAANETTVTLEPVPGTDRSKFIFEGPIQKPTPCNGLTANASIVSFTTIGAFTGEPITHHKAVVDIETTPFDGICIQVIADTYYKGSFEYTGLVESLEISYRNESLYNQTFVIVD